MSEKERFALQTLRKEGGARHALKREGVRAAWIQKRKKRCGLSSKGNRHVPRDSEEEGEAPWSSKGRWRAHGLQKRKESVVINVQRWKDICPIFPF